MTESFWRVAEGQLLLLVAVAIFRYWRCRTGPVLSAVLSLLSVWTCLQALVWFLVGELEASKTSDTAGLVYTGAIAIAVGLAWRLPMYLANYHNVRAWARANAQAR